MLVYEYLSPTWNKDSFESQGGIVAVVLNYNKASTIEQAVLSSLNQDFNNYEVLVMDDCSSDGSEVRMLNTVKNWCEEDALNRIPKAIHIKVIFNDVNKTTLQQWKYATELSNGKWFGMFCGDDIAYKNRLSVVHDILMTFPGVIALCTNGDVKDGGCLCGDSGFHIWSSNMGDRPFYFMHGCSCFWHRSILEKQASAHTLDDFVLYWSAIILASANKNLKIVWAYDKKTIAYSRSTGVTSIVNTDVAEKKFSIKDAWRKGSNIRKFGKKFGINTWNIIRAFNDKYGKDEIIREEILGYCHLGEMESGGWLDRLKTLYRVYILERSCDYGGKRSWICNMVRGLYISFFLGRFSFCCVEWIKFHRSWRRGRH